MSHISVNHNLYTLYKIVVGARLLRLLELLLCSRPNETMIRAGKLLCSELEECCLLPAYDTTHT